MPQIPDSHRDIIEKSQVVILGTSGESAEPQISTLLYLYEDGKLMFSINENRPQLKNLKNNPRLTAFFIDSDNPRRTLEIRGTARIDHDPDYLFGKLVGDKYGYDLRELDGPLDTRYKVTVNIENVHAFG